jgi:hypothetical protein
MIDGEHICECTAARAIEAINSRIESDSPVQTADAGSANTGDD